MTIKYSVQPSVLSPDGVTDPYGRYQVELQSDVVFQCSNFTTSDIADALKAGGTVVLLDSNSEVIGRIVPTVKGGFLISDSPSPLKEQANIGFTPSPLLLEFFRFQLTFAQVPTVQIVPTITSILWQDVEGHVGTDFVSTTKAGQLVLIGNNLSCL